MTASPAVFGMIHVGALPGTPRARETVAALAAHAVEEARLLVDAGFDGLLLENMHDVPYLAGGAGPEIVAAMTAIGAAVRGQHDVPLGVQILAAANREALAVAHAIAADFVRVENFAFAHVADEGLMPAAAAGPLLRYRRMIGAERVRILVDVKKKHASHALTADVSLAEAAKASEFFGADGIIVTGRSTGEPATAADVSEAKQSVAVPVYVGSGVSADNLAALWPHADAFIVGSTLKHDGRWFNPIDPARVERFMATVLSLRRRD